MSFHFLRPEWFIALIPLCWLCWLLYQHHVLSKNWAAYIDPRLLPFLISVGKGSNRKRPILLMALAGCLLITALAGPTWEKIPMRAFERQSALVILLDLSRSMDASDVKPSRLSRARLKLQDLLKHRQEGQTALIAFAATAYTVSPLTDDTHTIQSMISSLSTDIMPAQGSRPEHAIRNALELFENAAVSSGDILLITDGVSESSINNIQNLNLRGHSLSVISVGTAEGAPIADRSGGFVKDREGSIVVAKTDHSMLKAMASATGGIHSAMSVGDADITRLQSFIERRLQLPENELSDFQADRWHEVGPWLLLLVVPLAALAFRRGIILSLVIFVVLPMPQPSQAEDESALSFVNADTLWLNKEQQGHKLLQQGDAKSAANLFQQQDWKAAALYKSGQFEEALQYLDDPNSVSGHYNRANTLAHLGRFEESLQEYDKALQQDPQHQDALHNRKQVEQALKQQQQQQSNQSQSGEQGEQREDQENQQSEQQQDSNDSEQSNRSSEGDKSDTSDASQQHKQQEKEADRSSSQEKPQQMNEQQSQAQEPKQNATQQQQEAQQNNPSETLSEQAEAQWLRRIPDDPGGLLKNKFYYQYSQQKTTNQEKEPW